MSVGGPKICTKAKTPVEYGKDVEVVDLRNNQPVAKGHIVSIIVWPNGITIFLNTGYTIEVKGVKAKVVQMPEVNQAYILLGHPVPFHRGSPDYTPARVANYILGGSGFSSRIVKEVRVKHGYAYSTYSYFIGGFGWDESPITGFLQAGVETKLATGNDAVKLIRQLMREAKEKGFTEEELEAAKSYYRGSIARSAETYRQIAGLIITQADFGLPDLFWIKEIERIQKMSLEEVNSGARFYQPDDLVIAVVADTTFKLEGVERVEYVRWK